MMFSGTFSILKRGFCKVFDYDGADTRSQYAVFGLFQMLWFSLYLSLIAGDRESSFILGLLFLLPLLSSAVRRINDAGYSRGVIILLVLAPYIILIFLLFPPSQPKKQ